MERILNDSLMQKKERKTSIEYLTSHFLVLSIFYSMPVVIGCLGKICDIFQAGLKGVSNRRCKFKRVFLSRLLA